MIESYGFGKIVIDGIAYRKDIKIIKKSVIPDWRRKAGHLVEQSDISDVLSAKPDVLVVGTGYFGRLKLEKSLYQTLEQSNIRLIMENSRKAARTFNRLLKESSIVSAAFHLTC